MNAIRRVSAAARRRVFWRSLFATLGPALALGAGVSMAFVILEKVLGLGIPWPVAAGAPIVLAAILSLVLAIVRLPTPLGAAVEVDRSLGLRDRLTTGVAFTSSGPLPDDAFVHAAVADAEAAARQADIRRALPIRLGRSWIAWPILGALAVGLGLFLPAWSLLGRGDQSPEILAAAEQQQRTDLADEIASALRTVAPTPESPTLDTAAARRLEALEELQKELAAGAVEPEKAREEAADALQQLAGSMESAAQQAQRASDALRERLARAGSRSGDGAATSGLTQSLRRGDIAEAAEQAESLMSRLDEMSPEERAELARALEQLAQDLEELNRQTAEQGAPASAPDGADAQRSRAEEDLVRQGIDRQKAEELARQTDPEPIRKELEDRGVDPASARRLADRIAEENRQKQAEEEARRQAEELSRSLRDAADSLKNEDPSRPSQPQQPQQQDSRQQQGRQDQQQDQQPGQQEGQQGQGRQPGSEQGERKPGEGNQESQEPSSQPGAESPAGQRSDQAGEKQGEQGQQREGGRQGGEQGQQQNQQDGQQPGGQQQGGQQPGGQEPGGSEQGGQDPQQQQGDQQQGRQPGQGDQPGPAEPSHQGQQPGGGQSGGNEPGAQPGRGAEQAPAAEQTPGQPSGGAGQGNQGDQPRQERQPGAGGAGEQQNGPGGVEGLARQLREIAKSRQEAEKRRQDAQRLREQAREMLERADPETRERMKQWAEQLARESGRSGGTSRDGGGGAGDEAEPRDPSAPYAPLPMEGARTEIVDARPRTVSPTAEAPRERVVAEWLGDGKGGEPVSRREVQDRLVEAARSAERAVEDRVVPGRYDSVIRRYFRRLPEKVVPAEDAPAAPAKDVE